MLLNFSRQPQQRQFVLLAVMSAFCFFLSVFRVGFTGSFMFLFLNWNLVLAAIPWLLIRWLQSQHRKNPLHVIPVIMAWLVFFPNAPYILTDLFHLHKNNLAPLWYDLVLILSFAWTGLVFGYLSLLEIESLLRTRFHPRRAGYMVMVMLFSAAFGIYLGRYLRWNSWDILQDPVALFKDIGDRLMRPFAHPRTWGFTLFLGTLLNLIYWSLKEIIHRQPVSVTVE